MNSTERTSSLLGGYRVLDLTDEKGVFCGKILGDLGADVIKVERPGGDEARHLGPFYHDKPGPETSLSWFALNTNKRGITLNLATELGRDILKRLVATADFLVESFPPGVMSAMGLGFADLAAVNPRLVVASITPFGQDGPYSVYKAPDIVAMAMGGLMCLCGDPDRPPVRISVPQAHVLAGAQAAAGCMVAHYVREASGRGQLVDVSIQEAVVPTIYNARLFWEFGNVNLKRTGPYRSGLGALTVQRLHYPCRDGYVSFNLFGGTVGAPSNRRLVEWMNEDGMAPDFLRNKDWENWDFAKITQEELDRFQEPFKRFFMRRTKRELFEEAVKRRIMLYPLNTMKDIVEDPQLHERGFFESVSHPQLGTHILYPGPFAKFSETPLGIWRRAPLIGEHNSEIYVGELGMSPEELLGLKSNGVV